MKQISNIEEIRKFYRFLTGEEIPEGIKLAKGYKPKMSEKKAFSIIWYLQERMHILPDTIERCDVCGELYDTECEGLHWESKGKSYCGYCSHVVPENYDEE